MITENTFGLSGEYLNPDTCQNAIHKNSVNGSYFVPISPNHSVNMHFDMSGYSSLKATLTIGTGSNMNWNPTTKLISYVSSTVEHKENLEIYTPPTKWIEDIQIYKYNYIDQETEKTSYFLIEDLQALITPEEAHVILQKDENNNFVSYNQQALDSCVFQQIKILIEQNKLLTERLNILELEIIQLKNN